MSVRKRTWKTANGEERTAWIVDYADREGERHIETFPKEGRRRPPRCCAPGRSQGRPRCR
jgi:hypothetical protein